jgi:site-specific DNA-methyltransferase (adenine-specific)
MDTLPTSKNIADFTGRVWWADCLDLLAALPDKSVDMVLVDLPYGVTACAWDTIIPFAPMWEGIKRVVKKKAAVVMTATEPFASELRTSNRDGYRYDWIWEKQQPSRFLDANRKPLAAHENILVFYQAYNPQDTKPVHIKSGRKNKAGRGLYDSVSNSDYVQLVGNFPRTVIRFDIETFGTLHPTQKPVALFEYLIRTYTQAGEIVLDFCSGSATTAIACMNQERRWVCGDNHLPYVLESRQRVIAHNPFVDTPLKNGLVQKSLFASTEGEGA